MVAVTDATRPEVTAKLTVNGVEPKSTPLEGWWEELYHLRWWWCGCDLYSDGRWWQVERNEKSLHERSERQCLERGISLVAASMGQVILLYHGRYYGYQCEPCNHHNDHSFEGWPLPYLPKYMATQRRGYGQCSPIWTVQTVWVRFGLPKGVSLIVRQVWRRQALFRWRSNWYWQMQIRARWLQLYRQSTQRWPTD